jgi:hypothetical protein
LARLPALPGLQETTKIVENQSNKKWLAGMENNDSAGTSPEPE